MKYLRYRITLEAPVLVGTPDGDPNNVSSDHFLPGSLLRGALVGRYLPRQTQLDPNGTLRSRFLDGRTRFLHGYPVIDDHRLLPTPMVWVHEKTKIDQVYNLTHPDHRDLLKAPDKQWKVLRTPFRKPDPREVAVWSPQHVLTIHTQRSRAHGRAMPDDGAVFQYDALVAHQAFDAFILTPDEDTLGVFESMIDGAVVYLGRSLTADYGRARLTLIDDIDDIDVPGTGDVNGSETRHFEWSDARFNNNTIIVTLLSDLLLRNAFGQFCVDRDVFRHTLTRALGMPEDSYQIEAYMEETVVGGFNHTWGLPLPQMAAFRAGSVFILTGPEPDPDQIRLLEQNGMGERRAEGYGRLAFDAHGLWADCPKKELKLDHKTDDIPLTEDSVSGQLARRMVDRLWPIQARQTVSQVSQRIAQSIERPTPSQLQGLADQVKQTRRKDSTQALDRLVVYLHHLAERQVTRDQFHADTIEDETLGPEANFLDWMKHLVQDIQDESRDHYLIQNLWKNPEEAFQGLGGIEHEIGHTEARRLTLDLLVQSLELASKLQQTN
jgi:CRISPR-associated protein Csx10